MKQKSSTKRNPFFIFGCFGCVRPELRLSGVNLPERRVAELRRCSSSSAASAAELSSEVQPESQTCRSDHAGTQLTNSCLELGCSFLISTQSTFTCSYFLFKWSLTNICTGNNVTTVFVSVLNDHRRPIFYGCSLLHMDEWICLFLLSLHPH